MIFSPDSPDPDANFMHPLPARPEWLGGFRQGSRQLAIPGLGPYLGMMSVGSEAGLGW
jgi:hypothetical protein